MYQTPKDHYSRPSSLVDANFGFFLFPWGFLWIFAGVEGGWIEKTHIVMGLETVYYILRWVWPRSCLGLIPRLEEVYLTKMPYYWHKVMFTCWLQKLEFKRTCQKYRRFAVSWVSVQVAWVTFCVSFDNFLQISHCRYPKYFYPIK